MHMVGTSGKLGLGLGLGLGIGAAFSIGHHGCYNMGGADIYNMRKTADTILRIKIDRGR